MNADGYRYAAEMTDRLTTVIPRDGWDRKLVPELGSPARLFAHLIRVRGVYRDGFYTGELRFPGERVKSGTGLEEGLARSREELARAIEVPEVEKIRFGKVVLTLDELRATAIHHEGIHQGQWQVALKQAGLPLPASWREEWRL
ncbi:hypothetical protein C8P63_11916 [Melghirimyces profundicolus]|uniref:Damage-inducible protein DinB n=1 Tax=Melghirimyces profundicolus TaxID=1242148 RepID=A0A2T6BGX7_9BACL|nr:damage-inducible protein DinB [Melghirimyces profundicolus]PTX55309.1 hypothetical protein C8P63_11916 [Melghirimyces profundicolus]